MLFQAGIYNFGSMHALILALPPDVTGPEDGSGGGGGFGGIMIFLVPLLILFILMPLFNKKEKYRRKRLQAIKKHDKVVTSGGMYGTIISLDEEAVTIEDANDVRIKIKRTSVFDLQQPPTPQTKERATAKR